VDDAFTIVPLSPIRKMIAVRTSAAKQAIPHFRVCADIEADALLGQQRAGREESGERVSITDYLLKACGEALVETPALNVQWVEGEVRRPRSIDIAVVVALEEGISTPVVRGVDGKSLHEVSREVRAMSARARKNTLKMEEISGGSFSVSNLGMYGVPEFDAIINPPQCSILAVGAARHCVVPVGEAVEGTRIASIMRVTLSCDHRVIDGRLGAQFLAALKRRLEDEGYLRTLTEESGR